LDDKTSLKNLILSRFPSDPKSLLICVSAAFSAALAHSLQTGEVSKKRLRGSLDIALDWPKMYLSPPIRFWIEWACSQGKRHRFLVSGPFKISANLQFLISLPFGVFTKNGVH
jgi:hypothetical protein